MNNDVFSLGVAYDRIGRYQFCLVTVNTKQMSTGQNTIKTLHFLQYNRLNRDKLGKQKTGILYYGIIDC